MKILGNNKNYRYSLILFTAYFISSSIHAESLEQTVAKTLTTKPELRIAYNQFKAREVQVNQAFGSYLPSIEIHAGYGIENSDTPGTRRNTLHQGDVELKRGEAGISIKQMLFDGFLTSSEVSRFRHEANAERWSLLATAENTALQVSKVYINHLYTKQVQLLAEKHLQTHKDIFQQIKQRTDSGLGSTADLSQITGRLASANANLIAAKNNHQDAKVEFKRIVGSEPEKLIVPSPDRDMLPKDLHDALVLSKQHHPILKSASEDIKAASNEIDATKSAYYPKFTLELNGNWNNNIGGENGQNSQNDVGGHNNDLQAMIRVRYNIFSGGSDKARELASAYKYSESKEIKDKTLRQIEEGTHLAWNAHQLVLEQMQYIQSHVTSATDTQIAYYQQFELGQRSLLDVLDTENELFEARKNYLKAEYDALIAKYRVLNATGRLLDALKVTRPSSWL